MLGGEAETEALEVWGAAGLSYTPAKKIPPQTGRNIRIHVETVL